ncbi:MAG TPA: hypothetical protein VJR89_12630, partial [Polyangiales bacterium]|nr:hypothetical protein [Polyangiales bacterium]
KRTAAHAAFAALLVHLQSCAQQTELQVSTPDRAQFEAEVYPVLLRDCAFHTCHGSTERFLQVFGPGRGRMIATTPALDPPTPAELLHSYNRARSMLDNLNPDGSLLLRKPLATAEGGTGHEGVDALGRNVYQSADELGYRVLERWVRGSPTLPTVTGAMQ